MQRRVFAPLFAERKGPMEEKRENGCCAGSCGQADCAKGAADTGQEEIPKLRTPVSTWVWAITAAIGIAVLVGVALYAWGLAL